MNDYNDFSSVAAGSLAYIFVLHFGGLVRSIGEHTVCKGIVACLK